MSSNPAATRYPRRHEQSRGRRGAPGRGAAVLGRWANIFLLDAGTGVPVVCLHGVPTSSFLCRKLVPELARRGLRGITFASPDSASREKTRGLDHAGTK